MRTALVVALLLVTTAWAGCLGGGDEPGTPEGPPGEGNETPGDGTDPPEDGNATEASVAQSPDWVVGQWWRYEVDHSLAEPFEVTLVVASTSEGSYQLGWTDVDPGLRSVVFHLPPAGEISRPNLGGWWHGDTVEILDFPLRDGKTWQSQLGDQTLSYTATAQDVPGSAPVFTIEGTNETGALLVDAEYDAAVGFYSSIERFFEADGDPSPGVELLEFGIGAETSGGNGTVQVPTMTDLADVFATGADPTGQQQGSFTMAEEMDRLILAAFLGGGPGSYKASFTPPEGGPVVFTNPNGPGDDGVLLEWVFLDGPTGEWRYTANPTGPGFVISEAMGVSLESVQLAS